MSSRVDHVRGQRCLSGRLPPKIRRSILCPATIVTRLLVIIPVLLGVVFVVMLTLDLIPGDPVALMLGDNARPEEVAALRANLGLDDPLIVRYVRYLGDVVRGDLGRSILSNRPVVDEIADVFPKTLQLALAAMVLAVILGVATGIISAMRPGGAVDAVDAPVCADRALHARLLARPGADLCLRLLPAPLPGGRHRHLEAPGPAGGGSGCCPASPSSRA